MCTWNVVQGIQMVDKTAAAMKWLEKNSETLGKKYKDLWLAIGSNGVKDKSRSYSKIADQAAGKNYLLIKVPRNPQVARII